MPKKIIASIIALSFLGLFLWKNKKAEPLPIMSNEKTDHPSSIPSQKPNLDHDLFLQNLIRPEQEPSAKVKLIDQVDYQDVDTRQALITFIISPNPHKSTDPIDPHSFTAHQHQREASLRVYALKVLAETLSIEHFESVVRTIEREADDAAIIRIAKQALHAKQNGENYFENLKKGIQATPLPEDED